MVHETADKSDFIDDKHADFWLAYKMQTHRPSGKPVRHQQIFAHSFCPSRLGKAINMLIQKRIAGIDKAEKIDLGWQLSHFRKNWATMWLRETCI